MRALTRLGGLRAVLIVITAMGALYMALVAFTNITDFGTNRAFVEHVLAMDTTFRSPSTMWRAITSPGLALAAYLAIIAWEVLTAAVLAVGVVAWLRGLPTARAWSSLGWLMVVALFGVGFIAIGGEWFLMWQSDQWNGLEPAVNNTLIAAAALVLTHLPSRPRPAAC